MVSESSNLVVITVLLLVGQEDIHIRAGTPNLQYADNATEMRGLIRFVCIGGFPTIHALGAM
jgi:hypothetical protein